MSRAGRDMAGANTCPKSAPDRPETSWSVTPRKSGETGGWRETSCEPVNRLALQEVSRARFAELLRMAFPGESEAATAALAAQFLACSDRTVLNWLRHENSPPFDVVFAIGCRIGVFAVMDVMTQGQSRSSVLGMIVKGVRCVAGR